MEINRDNMRKLADEWNPWHKEVLKKAFNRIHSAAMNGDYKTSISVDSVAKADVVSCELKKRGFSVDCYIRDAMNGKLIIPISWL